MKNQQFELNLLIKQNTEMAIKLQFYRRENQEFSLKNRDLNCWVQNLSQVFASISAAWKMITDNEEALYTLMKKKSETNSKQLVGTYISHFKAFDQIISNLGDKITNEGHSNSVALDAKARLASFVNNYNLFFMEFVQSFFKFNQQCISLANQKLKEPNFQAPMRQIAAQSIENRQKIKEFQEFIVKLSQNFKIYETYNQHQLLDGIIIQKNQEIQELKDKTLKQARRIAYMTDYNSENVNFLLQKDENFECFCGGAPLQYFNKVWQQNLKKQSNNLKKQQSSQMMDEEEQTLRQKMKEFNELQVEKQLLMQRNVQIQVKCQKIKLQNKLSDDIILQSPLYIHLRSQFKDLMDYTNDLTMRLSKSYEYLNQIQKIRLQEIEQVKKKYQKSNSHSHRQHQSEQIPIVGDNVAFIKFKQRVEGHFLEIKNIYTGIHQKIKDKQDGLQQNKDNMKYLKKENQDLNRRLGELQQKQLKAIENIEFRHQKFNDLQKSMSEIFKNYPHSEQLQKTRKVWQQFVEYTKTRDKKIKAMEDVMKKKDREIAQKQKVEEVMKNAMTETEDIYEKYKQKLNSYEQFMKKIQNEILNLSEEIYKIKIESEQEKNILSIRLKNELEVKNKLEERVKACDKIQEEVKTTRSLLAQFQRRFQEYQTVEREKINTVKLEFKEKERSSQQLSDLVTEKDKLLEKLVEDKQKKNLQINKLHLKLSSKTEFEVLRIELDQYKSKIMCRCGAERQREVVLKTCPHIFCKKCIEDTTANRNRKCPICGVRFTKTDIHEINWT